jgi:hypothetical protein
VSHSVDSTSNATDERVSTPIGPPVLRQLRRACLAQHDDKLRMTVLLTDYPQTYWCPHFHRKLYCTLLHHTPTPRHATLQCPTLKPTRCTRTSPTRYPHLQPQLNACAGRSFLGPTDPVRAGPSTAPSRLGPNSKVCPGVFATSTKSMARALDCHRRNTPNRRPPLPTRQTFALHENFCAPTLVVLWPLPSWLLRWEGLIGPP